MHIAIRRQGKSVMLAACFSPDDMKHLKASGVNPLATFWKVEGDVTRGLLITQVSTRDLGRKMQRETGVGKGFTVYFRPGPLGAKLDPIRKSPVKATLSRGRCLTEPLPEFFHQPAVEKAEKTPLSQREVAGMTPSAERQPVLDDLYAAVELVNELKTRLRENITLEVEEDGLLGYTVKHKPVPKGNHQLKAVK